MFVANTGLRAEKAESSLRNIMTASVEYMFEDAAQVRAAVCCLLSSYLAGAEMLVPLLDVVLLRLLMLTLMLYLVMWLLLLLLMLYLLSPL